MAQQAAQVVSHQVEGPRSAVEHIAAFAAAARPEQLKRDVRQLFKRNILDSLGCALAALPGQPFKVLREVFEEYRAPGRCTLIGGGKTSADQAALFNSGLTRYVDLLDSYMSPGGLCHPSDNFGSVLAAAEQAGASGEEFMLALAVSYEIQCRFTAVVPVMVKSFNHATQLAMSVAAAGGKLFGLSVEQIANAISIATADSVSLACIHVEPVSQWKGFSPGSTGMRAVYAASMAKHGFTGPRGLFEGPMGLNQVFGPIPVDWDDPSLEFVKQTVLKKYCSLIHGQPVIEATLDVRRSYNVRPVDVEHIRCDTFKAGYDFAGGGSYGSKDHPWLKEQGDYNLKYLISAALLDGQVGPDQLTAARIQAPDAQAMVARIEVQPDDQLTARFPKELAARITVRTKDGRTLVKEHVGYEGGLDQPMSWDRVVEKFHWLSEPFADENLRSKIIDAVQKLDAQPISSLMDLLAQAHSGIPENSCRNLVNPAGSPRRNEVPMSEQAARKQEALKEPVHPHQPGQETFRSILAEDIEWKSFAAFPPEAGLAVLVGRPLESGPYMVRVKVPHGVKLMPHWHPEDRIYTVISGVFYIGLGDQFDADKLEAYPPGAVIILPGNTSHFHWAKSGEYITQVTAIGPLGLEYVNSKDDPRNIAS